MKQLILKTSSLLLAVLFLLNIFAVASFAREQTFEEKLADVMSRYRQGEYFAGNKGTGKRIEQTVPYRLCNNENCIKAGYCGAEGCRDNCNCGTYYGKTLIASQCMGFACQVGNDIFGSDVYAEWTRHKNASAVVPGDVVRYNRSKEYYAPHSIFVIKVENGIVYFGDCNGGGPCRVDWTKSISLANLQEYLNNRTETDIAVYHAPENNSGTDPDPGTDPYVPPVTPDEWEIFENGNYYLTNGNGEYLQFAGGIKVGGYFEGDGCMIGLEKGECGYKLIIGGNNTLMIDSEKSKCWIFKPVADGSYAIYNAVYENFCITANNGTVAIAPYSGLAEQQWQVKTSVVDDKIVTGEVRYDANGGTNAPAVQQKYLNTPLVISNVIPVREGYDFYGWSTNIFAKDGEYFGGDEYTDEKSITLYAVWRSAEEHHFESKVLIPATCTQEGLVNWVCTDCGETYMEKTAKLPHDYVVVITEPTCTEKGYTEHKCSDCGDTYIDSETDVVDHTFGEWTVEIPAAVGVPGKEVRVCSGCGKTDTREIPSLSDVKKGDLNADDRLTVADARIALRIAARLDPTTEYALRTGDLDGDGKISIAEARKILRVAAKIDTF